MIINKLASKWSDKKALSSNSNRIFILKGYEILKQKSGKTYIYRLDRPLITPSGSITAIASGAVESTENFML